MKNISELSKKFDNIQKVLINNLVQAQRDTAYDVCDDVKELAPKKTGRYRESIKVGETEVKKNKIETEVYTDATVISSKGMVYNLGYLLETGTSPHLIEPVNAKALHFVIDGEDIFTKRVNHPGSVAIPHFSIGLEMNERNYKENIREAIRRSLNG